MTDGSGIKGGNKNTILYKKCVKINGYDLNQS